MQVCLVGLSDGWLAGTQGSAHLSVTVIFANIRATHAIGCALWYLRQCAVVLRVCVQHVTSMHHLRCMHKSPCIHAWIAFQG